MQKKEFEEASSLAKNFCRNTLELAKLFAQESEGPGSKEAVARLELFFLQMCSSDLLRSPIFAGFFMEKGLTANMIEILVDVQQAGKSFQGSGCLITRCFLRVFVSFSDKSLEFCQNLSEQAAYFRVFYPNLLSSQDAKNVTMYSEGGESIYAAIATVFNCYYKNDSATLSRLSQYDELVACTRPYLECMSDDLSTMALILIAFAANEKSPDVLLGAMRNMRFLIHTLEKAVSSDNRSSNGYGVRKAANCISRLALNDKNKDLLIEMDISRVVRKMLSSYSDEDVTKGIEILLALSFSKNCAEIIKSEFQQILDKLHSIEQWRGYKELLSLLILINELPAGSESIASKPASVAKKSHYRVLISYSHDSKLLVERLYEKLVEAKVDVWVDFKEMKSGSVYDQLAEGVESSSILLMCITKLYQESSFCRLEVQYAHELKKKLIPVLMEPNYQATGWLRLLTEGVMMYDLSESKPQFEDQVKKLLSAISQHSENPTGSPVSPSTET